MKKNKKLTLAIFARSGMHFVLTCMLLLLTGCSSEPVSTTPTLPLKIELQARSDINPNKTGQANPVRVSIYQLMQTDDFISSDYFSLHDSSDPDLNAQMSKSYDLIMLPGEKKEVTLKLKEDTAAIGIITNYREISESQWKLVQDIPERPKDPWYKKLWLMHDPIWQPKIVVHIEHLTTSIDKVN